MYVYNPDMTFRRFQDRVDVLADRLGDAAETYRSRRDKLLVQLSQAKDAYDTMVFAAEEWAHKEGLITLDPQELWVDEEGEPFLPTARCDVLVDIVPDLATMFRERVAGLKEEGDA